MPPNPYYYSGDITAENLRNVQLPEKIRCDRCNRYKGHGNFARKRLNDIRYRIKFGNKNTTATCSACTGQQITELECHMCRTWKGLEDFAKAQRKNPDKAKCNNCMKEQLETEPVEAAQHADVDSSSEEDEDDSDWDARSDDEYDSMGRVKYAASTVGSTATGNLVGDIDGQSVSGSESTTTGFYTPFQRNTPALSVNSDHPASTGWSGFQNTGFNEYKYGHPGAQKNSYANSAANSTKINVPTSNASSKWAKVPAYKPEPKPKEHTEEEEDDLWGNRAVSDTDSDNDDESDDGM